MKITVKKVDSLIPYVKNSRTHSPDQVAQIAASIKEFGWTNPILVDGDNGIIAGHGRLMAARKLGHKEVPTIELKDLTETQKKAYIIADNRLALNAGWDNEMLTIELNDLLADGFALDILGFDPKEIAALLEPEMVEGLTDEDAVPEVPEEPKTRLGDIYQLGNHRLMCGDSTSIDAVDKLMDGQKADMIFTDPPYGIGYEYDEHKDDDNESNAQLVWDVFALHDCGKVWTPGLMNLARDIERFGKTKVAVWHKKFAMAGNGIGGASTWEPILILNAKKKSLKNDVLVIKTDKEYVDGKNLRELHSCPKPVGLYVELINSLAESKSNIFEPFCGSGTTLISCEKTTRKCFGMEMSPKYCDVIVKRWEDFTGKKATLLTEVAETA
jgi:DNA modification methylase